MQEWEEEEERLKRQDLIDGKQRFKDSVCLLV